MYKCVMLISETEYWSRKRNKFSIKEADFEWVFSSETEDIEDDKKFKKFLKESFVNSTNSRLLIKKWEEQFLLKQQQLQGGKILERKNKK
jgi:hypothetical protein